MPSPRTPIRLAILNDYEVVVAGLARMLAPFPQFELAALTTHKRLDRQVDIALFDTFAPIFPTHAEIAAIRRNRLVGRLAVYSLDVSERAVGAAAALGVDAYLSKALRGEQLAEALFRVYEGEKVVITSAAADEQHGGEWPGRSRGLTNREAEVLSLIVAGLTNQEICERLYLTDNSVKSYIRGAYRKIGVARRSQAVSWGFENGFAPHAAEHGEGHQPDPRDLEAGEPASS